MADVYRELAPEENVRIEKCIDTLSLNEKIGQMVNQGAKYVMQKSAPAQWLKKYPLGSIFSGSEVIDNNATSVGKNLSLQTVVEQAELSVPMLYCGDFESGIGYNIEGFTAMPRLMGLSATFSDEDSYDYGKVIGSEGRAIHIRWGFGPVSDLNLNRENPVTNIRSCGDNPDHAIRILTGIIRGMQDYGVAACAKHFPGDGTDTRNQHLVTSLNLLSKEEWNRQHGRVFKALIDAGVMSVMVGHLGFPAYEPMDEKSRMYCPGSCSFRIVSNLLRGELGFKGVVVTDAMNMVGYRSWGDYESRIIDGINAGIDIFLWPDAERFFPLVKAALKDGRIAMETIEKSLRRILTFKTRLGLIPAEANPEKSDVPALLKENTKIARRIAEDSITLLRNRNRALPLKLRKGAKILVLYAPDHRVVTKQMEYFRQKLEEHSCQVTLDLLAQSGDYRDQLEDFDCVMVASDANPQYCTHRTADWGVWDIVGSEKIRNLIVLSFGTPYFLYDMASVVSYVNAYHDCNFSIEATVKALFGEIPFKGKSPVGAPHCFAFGDGLRK